MVVLTPELEEKLGMRVPSEIPDNEMPAHQRRTLAYDRRVRIPIDNKRSLRHVAERLKGFANHVAWLAANADLTEYQAMAMLSFEITKLNSDIDDIVPKRRAHVGVEKSGK
jgi:hypothetical protein